MLMCGVCLTLMCGVCLTQKLLAGMRDRGANAAVLEVDTEAQATGSLQWVQPTISVFTNLGDDPSSMFSSKEVGANSSCAAVSRRTTASMAFAKYSHAARRHKVQVASLHTGLTVTRQDCGIHQAVPFTWRLTCVNTQL